LAAADGELATARSNLKWNKLAMLMLKEISSLIPPGETFLLVDDDQVGGELFSGRTAWPFLERDGKYWGPPSDDASAICELERLRQLGASFTVFAWPAFWWLDYYAGFHSYLREKHPCVLENDRVVVFDLRR
jgi:hypothetical protein